jgi:hypothetical protein
MQKPHIVEHNPAHNNRKKHLDRKTKDTNPSPIPTLHHHNPFFLLLLDIFYLDAGKKQENGRCIDPREDWEKDAKDEKLFSWVSDMLGKEGVRFTFLESG